MADITDWLVPIGTFIGGWLLRPLIPSKMESYTMKKQAHDVQKARAADYDEAARSFMEELQRATGLRQHYESDPNEEAKAALASSFWELRARASTYFMTANELASLVISGVVPERSFTRNWDDEVRRVALETIPTCYRQYKELADDLELEYSDRLTMGTYASVRNYLKKRMTRDDYLELLAKWDITDQEYL